MAATAHTTPPLIHVESDVAATRRLSRRPPFVREIAFAVVAYLIYEAARLLTAGSYPSALAHAQQVIALERDMNLDVDERRRGVSCGGHDEFLTMLHVTIAPARAPADGDARSPSAGEHESSMYG